MGLLNCVSYALLFWYVAAGSGAGAILKREAPIAGGPSQTYLPASGGFGSNFGKPQGVFGGFGSGASDFNAGHGFGGGASKPTGNYLSPSSNYGAPAVASTPSLQYGTPSSGGYNIEHSVPSHNYGLPSFGSGGSGGVFGSSGFGHHALSQSYSAPSRPALQYGAPSQQSQFHGSISQSYGASSRPSYQHTTLKEPSQSYSTSSSSSHGYGVPLSQSALSQSYGSPAFHSFGASFGGLGNYRTSVGNTYATPSFGNTGGYTKSNYGGGYSGGGFSAGGYSGSANFGGKSSGGGYLSSGFANGAYSSDYSGGEPVGHLGSSFGSPMLHGNKASSGYASNGGYSY